MFKNLRKKTKKNLNWEKKSKIIFFSSCPGFVFTSYAFISPNISMILEKKLHIRVDLKEAPHF